MPLSRSLVFVHPGTGHKVLGEGDGEALAGGRWSGSSRPCTETPGCSPSRPWRRSAAQEDGCTGGCVGVPGRIAVDPKAFRTNSKM